MFILFCFSRALRLGFHLKNFCSSTTSALPLLKIIHIITGITDERCKQGEMTFSSAVQVQDSPAQYIYYPVASYMYPQAAQVEEPSPFHPKEEECSCKHYVLAPILAQPQASETTLVMFCNLSLYARVHRFWIEELSSFMGWSSTLLTGAPTLVRCQSNTNNN